MILIESKCFTSLLEAKQEERKHIEELNASLNCKIPSRTNQAWRESNKEMIRLQQQIYKRNYRVDHKGKIQKHQSVIYQRNKERISIKMREYYIANRKEILERARGYREKVTQNRL